MTHMSAKTQAPYERKVLGMVLLSMGLYAIVLALTIPLALLSWQGAGSSEASLRFLLLTVICLFGGCLLSLASLLVLRVHWLLVIGVFLVALILAYVQGRLLRADNAFTSQGNEFLTFIGVVLVLSLILLSLVKGIWPSLWRTLLVTAVSAAITVAVAYVCGQIAAADSGPINGQPPTSLIYVMVSLLVGSLDILIIYFWLTSKGIKSSYSEE